MEAHLQAVSILYRVTGILWLLVSALVGVLMAFLGSLMSYIARDSHEVPPMEFFVFFGIVMVAGFALLGLLHFVAGLGFKGGRSWARILVIILAICDLFLNIPFGTAIGIYTLWVCLSGKTAHLFMQSRA